MTEEQILEIASGYFVILNPFGGFEFKEYAARESGILEFAKVIRKQTIEEILSSLRNVPNPEANRTAINCIEWRNYDRKQNPTTNFR